MDSATATAVIILFLCAMNVDAETTAKNSSLRSHSDGCSQGEGAFQSILDASSPKNFLSTIRTTSCVTEYLGYSVTHLVRSESGLLVGSITVQGNGIDTDYPFTLSPSTGLDLPIPSTLHQKKCPNPSRKRKRDVSTRCRECTEEGARHALPLQKALFWATLPKPTPTPSQKFLLATLTISFKAGQNSIHLIWRAEDDSGFKWMRHDCVQNGVLRRIDRAAGPGEGESESGAEPDPDRFSREFPPGPLDGLRAAVGTLLESDYDVA